MLLPAAYRSVTDEDTFADGVPSWLIRRTEEEVIAEAVVWSVRQAAKR